MGREAWAMRRLLLLATVTLASANSGCLLNTYSPDPNERVQELLNNSEDMRTMRYTWERIWFNDEPSHLTPDRVDGSVQ
jgi:hypothetical protein